MSVRLTLVAATAAVLAAQCASAAAHNDVFDAAALGQSESSYSDDSPVTLPASTTSTARPTAPPSRYPVTLGFVTRAEKVATFWTDFKSYLRGLTAQGRSMELAADENEFNGRLFLGCYTKTATTSTCSVGFSSVTEATTVQAAANSGGLSDLGVTAADVEARASFAAGRSTLAALAAVAVSAVTMLLA